MANSSIRYGASIRKRFNEVKREKRELYKCDLCSQMKVKRISTSIWKCKHCGTVYAGGAYSMKTSAGENAKSVIEALAKK
ncbi:MAG: 50S ribosomal protein L37ae [Candidatus Micrarchaeota archaeon]|nr:50S ribosomal protein L37ae [Candidatus Micrarchaeota archaeon]